MMPIEIQQAEGSKMPNDTSHQPMKLHKSFTEQKPMHRKIVHFAGSHNLLDVIKTIILCCLFNSTDETHTRTKIRKSGN